MNYEFLPAARQLAAAYFELYAVSIGVEGPLAQSQIQEAGHFFSEILLAYGIKQLIEFQTELLAQTLKRVPPLDSSIHRSPLAIAFRRGT